MNRTLSAITAVCVVCAAAKSKAEVNILGGSLRHWQSIEGVGTTHEGSYNLGKNESGSEVPANVLMAGIEDALIVAIELIRSDDNVVQTIEQFTSKGHREYNKNGNPNSQNFVVMVVKLAGMIAGLRPCSMICPDQVCEHCLTVTANGQPKWWQIVGEDEKGRPIIKNEDHDAIRDCELYIENFKIKEYLDDVQGAIFCMANRERQDRLQETIDYGGRDMDVSDGDSNIEAAYQIMALLPKYYEEAGKAMENINQAIASNRDPQDENAELKAAKAHKDLIGASLIAITGISHQDVVTRNGRQYIGTRLISIMLKTAIDANIIEKNDTPLQIIKKTVEIVSKYNECSRVKQNLYAQRRVIRQGADHEERRQDRIDELENSAVYDVTFIDGTEQMIDQINDSQLPDGSLMLPCQFGEYPAFEIGNGRPRLVLPKRRNSDFGNDIAYELSRLTYSDPLSPNFWWNGSRWEPIPGLISGSAAYCFDAAIIRTEQSGREIYMTARMGDIDRSGGSCIVNGKECSPVLVELIKQRSSRNIDLGEVCAVFYRRVAPRPKA
jgi:hypothetical protein